MRHLTIIVLAVSVFFGQFNLVSAAPALPQSGCLFMPMIRGQQQSQVFNGNGSEILTVHLNAGTVQVKGTSCKGAFVVEVYSVQGNRVGMPIDCNGICSDKQGTVRVPSNGTYLINVTATSNWSLSLF